MKYEAAAALFLKSEQPNKCVFSCGFGCGHPVVGGGECTYRNNGSEIRDCKKFRISWISLCQFLNSEGIKLEG